MLTTPRLTLRPLQLGDAPAIAAYRTDPDVMRYQSWSEYSLARAEALVASQQGIGPDEPGTWLQLAIVNNATGQLIGDCGLHCFALEPNRWEFGITMAKASQGQGFARETLDAVLEFAFLGCGKRRVTAVTDAENLAAIKLFERLGFCREGFLRSVWFKDRNGQECHFGISVDEWTESKRKASVEA